MSQQCIAVYGMGVMGRNIALNFRHHGANVVVYNRTKEKITHFLDGEAAGAGIRGAYSLQELCALLPRPRKILLMVEAGPATDKVLDGLAEMLDKGDIVIDGGNSHYTDTERRANSLAERGLKFFGMGISGGEEGALKGPSLMPGGDRETYDLLEPLLKSVAAKTSDGPCVTYLGPGGAGHLVKMVHNGIEYGDMQLIAEAYDVLRTIVGLSPDEMRATFEKWNQTDLQSFLIEITARIVDFADDQGDGLLLDKILDSAGQKGTGRWAIILANQLASPVPTIAAAVDSRVLSSLLEERKVAAEVFSSSPQSAKPTTRKDDAVENVRKALLASKICSYAQGMALLHRASQQFEYGLNYAEIARIWQAGCIIRAGFLKDISAAFRREKDLPNLLVDSEFASRVADCEAGWRATVALATSAGVPTPAISASLAYFDSYRRERLPAYLIQAQRDFFGAHTYKRVDKEGVFHTQWPEVE